MNRVRETERLYLRELTGEGRGDLGRILGDPETMGFYPVRRP